MNRKTLILCVSTVALLATIYAVAVVFLYSPAQQKDSLLQTEQTDSTTQISVKADSLTQVAAIQTVVTHDTPAREDDVTAASQCAGEAVVVPEGPFEVKNPNGGRPCTIAQKADGSIEMLDPAGRQLWTLALPSGLNGRVCCVDYFANGKTQYLFTSGDALYLVDRLGRVVKGFPVKLGSQVLLGPDVYDFSGAHRYNIMVLDAAGGIEMYNLKGVRPEKWKRIALKDNIIGLPEYAEKKGRSYWIVRTAGHSYVYSFYGEQLKAFAGEADMNAID